MDIQKKQLLKEKLLKTIAKKGFLGGAALAGGAGGAYAAGTSMKAVLHAHDASKAIGGPVKDMADAQWAAGMAGGAAGAVAAYAAR